MRPDAADLDPGQVQRLVAAVCARAPVLAEDITCRAPVWVAARSAGRRVWSAWLETASLAEALRCSLTRPGSEDADAFELCLPESERNVRFDDFDRVFTNARRGLLGIELACGDVVRRVAPTQTISSNRRFARELDRFLHDAGVSRERFMREGTVRAFTAHQLLVVPAAPRVHVLFRGNRVVAPPEPTPDSISAMIESMAGWLAANMSDDGRLPYKYWPSRGEESKADNAIRRLLGTLALTRLAAHTGEAAWRERAERNLRWMLRHYHVDLDGVGSIMENGKAKLGAAALGALCILEQPWAAGMREPFDKLCRGIDLLWQPEGWFRTFLRPPGRDDNQNFYPGEALLFWALWHRRTGDAALRERCLMTFARYRDWHRGQRNPAFVPWHTQACAVLFADAGEAALRDFVFEMNDWLLPMQQWNDGLAPDLWGRFYDPLHPDYGPPHASSTGVYLEGLADALALAQDCGDGARAAAYRRTIRRGLRSLRQLQFVDDIDMFYVSKRRKVAGALRTEAYDNEVRIDNLAHALLALLKLARMPDFTGGEHHE